MEQEVRRLEGVLSLRDTSFSGRGKQPRAFALNRDLAGFSQSSCGDKRPGRLGVLSSASCD